MSFFQKLCWQFLSVDDVVKIANGCMILLPFLELALNHGSSQRMKRDDIILLLMFVSIVLGLQCCTLYLFKERSISILSSSCLLVFI